MRQFIGSVRDDDRPSATCWCRSPRPRSRRAGEARGRRRAGDDGAATTSRRRWRTRTALADWGDARRLRRRGALGHCAPSPRSACPYDRCKYREVTHAVRRRAEAAGAGGAAARPGRGAAARRAGQLPRRARQALAGGAAARRPARRCCSSATTASCWPARADRIVTVEGRARRLGARRRVRLLPRGPQGPARADGRAAPALGRGARPAQGAGAAPCSSRPSQPRAWPRGTTAAQTRLRRFEEAGPPPEPPREQEIRCGCAAAAPACAR